jgi:hypothetical protein
LMFEADRWTGSIEAVLISSDSVLYLTPTSPLHTRRGGRGQGKPRPHGKINPVRR